MTFKAIIFDMDGLLVDSEVVWHEAETALFAERGINYTDEIRAQVIGFRLDEFFTHLKTSLDLTDTVDELCIELTRRMIKLIPTQVKAQPGASELVTFVAQKKIPTAIASSSPQSIIDATVTSQMWDDVFRLRCSADDVARGKPAPDVYLYTAENLAIHPAQCLALEDSPTGAKAAVAAGMTCYAVPDKSHSHPEKFAGITPHIFDSLHEVLEHLKQNGHV